MAALTQAQIRDFFDIGFIVRPRIFAPAEVAEMRIAFDRLQSEARSLGKTGMHRGSQFVLGEAAAGDPGPVCIKRIVWCGAAAPVLSRYGKDPRLLEMAAQLLGSRAMQQLINQAHYKMPGDAVEFPWHQDSTHRRYGRGEWSDLNGLGSYVQTVIALDAMTESNGPLQFLPGSCKLGHVEPDPRDGGWPLGTVDAGRAVSATMAAGDVLLFGPYTFHRSLPNRSDKPRRVFINGYAFPGANQRVYPGEGAGRLLRVS